jgi:hypothetical protein
MSTLRILSMQQIKQDKEIPADAQWCYLGSSCQGRASCRELLPEKQELDYPDEFQQVSIELKTDYLEWFSALGSDQPDPLIWWSSAMASKSPLQTDFYDLLCYVELVKRWTSQEKMNLWIIVEDPWLIWLLGSNKFRKGCISGALIKKMMWGFAKAVVARAVFFVESFLLLLISHFIPHRVSLDPATPVSVLFTWIIEKSFRPDGTIQDIYTGELADVLRSMGRQVVFLTPGYVNPAYLWKLRRCKSPLLLSPRYIRPCEVFKIAFSFFHLHRLNDHRFFRGLDHRALLLRSWIAEQERRTTLRNRLLSAIAGNMSDVLGKQIRTIIYPFENQSWEKAFCLGWKEKGNVRLVGYQHAAFGEFSIHFFSGLAERKKMPLPHHIVASGQSGYDLLIRAGYPEDMLSIGGALRYKYLHKLASEQSNSSDEIILALFPGFPTAASLFYEALVRGWQHNRKYQLVIKCHPMLPLDKIIRAVPIEPIPFMNKSSDSLDNLLTRTKLMIYAPSTTAFLEGYAMGIPIIRFRGSFLDMDRGVGDIENELSFATSGTLWNCMEKLLEESNRNQKNSPVKRKAFLQRVFPPLQKDVWKRLTE